MDKILKCNFNQHFVNVNLHCLKATDQITNNRKVAEMFCIFPDLSEMLHHHGRDAAKDVVVRQPVEEAVNGHRHVARLHRTVVLK